MPQCLSPLLGDPGGAGLALRGRVAAAKATLPKGQTIVRECRDKALSPGGVTRLGVNTPRHGVASIWPPVTEAGTRDDS